MVILIENSLPTFIKQLDISSLPLALQVGSILLEIIKNSICYPSPYLSLQGIYAGRGRFWDCEKKSFSNLFHYAPASTKFSHTLPHSESIYAGRGIF